MKKRFYKNNFNRILITIIVLLVSGITIGFAAYDQLLTIGGNVNISKIGKVEITNVTLLESNNITSNTIPYFYEQNLVFDLEFTSSTEKSYAIYEITLINNSNLDYVYSGSDIEQSITSSVLEDTGTLNIEYENIDNGLLIPAGQSVVFKYKIEINDEMSGSIYNVNTDTDLSFILDNTGNLVATLNTSSIDLTDNKTGYVEIAVINTYSYERDFYVSQTNNNLIINNNENIKYTIPANSTQTYTVSVSASPDAIFLTNSETTTFNIKPTYLAQMSIGNINISVDEYVAPDTEIPTVGNAYITIQNTEGEFLASWNRVDTEGTSIVNYNLKLYDSSNRLVTEVNTQSSDTSYTFTGISAGSYYFVVSGEDAAGNTGISYMDSATFSNGYATKSSTVELKWKFDVKYSLRGVTSRGASSAYLNMSFTTTISANTRYTLPESITITMGGDELSSGSDYDYSNDNGVITIYQVTDDVNISANGTRNTCLIEGTKILLADNSYKNIEDIRYDDLLKIYSYEEGRSINVYPIWIEKKNSTSYYQLNTFSDGTILKTVGFHGIYDVNKNLFISVDNKEDFKVGTEVAIFDTKTNKLKKVTVTNIKEITETANYYHVVSTRYYNVIANNLLTTDGTTILSNLYGFNSNVTWTSLRKNIMSDSSNLYNYNDFSDIMPYYMYKGLRVEEGKILNNYGLDLNTFKGYLSSNQLNNDLMLEPIKNDKDNRVWMVTTSDDIVKNKADYLVEEGSFYKIKEPKIKENFAYWYNTGTGEHLKPGDTIQIWFGTYLEAIYN